MPDAEGFEILSGSRWAPSVLHHPCDRRVINTARARREHLTSCNRGARARAAAEQAARDHERAILERVAHQFTIDQEGKP